MSSTSSRPNTSPEASNLINRKSTGGSHGAPSPRNSAQAVAPNKKATQPNNTNTVSQAVSPSLNSAGKAPQGTAKANSQSNASLQHSRPHRSAKSRLRQKMANCPLCMGEFTITEIERHASQCMEINSSGEKKKEESRNDRYGGGGGLSSGGGQQHRLGTASRKKKRKSFPASSPSTPINQSISYTNTSTSTAYQSSGVAEEAAASSQASPNLDSNDNVYSASGEKKTQSLVQRPVEKKKKAKKRSNSTNSDPQSEVMTGQENTGTKIKKKKYKKKKALVDGSEEDLEFVSNEGQGEAQGRKTKKRWHAEVDEGILSASLNHGHKQHATASGPRSKKRKKGDHDLTSITHQADGAIQSQFPSYLHDRKKKWVAPSEGKTNALPMSTKPYASVNDAQNFLKLFRNECCHKNGGDILPLLKFLSYVRLCRTGKMSTYQLLAHCKSLFNEVKAPQKVIIQFENFLPSLYGMENVLPQKVCGDVEVEIGSARTNVSVIWQKSGVEFRNETDKGDVMKEKILMDMATSSKEPTKKDDRSQLKSEFQRGDDDESDTHAPTNTSELLAINKDKRGQSKQINRYNQIHHFLMAQQTMKSSVQQHPSVHEAESLKDNVALACLNVHRNPSADLQKGMKQNIPYEFSSIAKHNGQGSVVSTQENNTSSKGNSNVKSLKKQQDEIGVKVPLGKESKNKSTSLAAATSSTTPKGFVPEASTFKTKSHNSSIPNTNNKKSPQALSHLTSNVSAVHDTNFESKATPSGMASIESSRQGIQSNYKPKNVSNMSIPQKRGTGSQFPKNANLMSRSAPNQNTPKNPGGKKNSSVNAAATTQTKTSTSRSNNKAKKGLEMSIDKSHYPDTASDRKNISLSKTMFNQKVSSPNQTQFCDNFKNPTVPDPLQTNKMSSGVSFGVNNPETSSQESFASYVHSLKMKEMQAGSSVAKTATDYKVDALKGVVDVKRGRAGTSQVKNAPQESYLSFKSAGEGIGRKTATSTKPMSRQNMTPAQYIPQSLEQYQRKSSIATGSRYGRRNSNNQQVVKSDTLHQDQSKSGISTDASRLLKLKQTEDTKYNQIESSHKASNMLTNKYNSEKLSFKSSVDKSWEAISAASDLSNVNQYATKHNEMNRNLVKSKMQDNKGIMQKGTSGLMMTNKDKTASILSGAISSQAAQHASQNNALKHSMIQSAKTPSPWYMDSSFHPSSSSGLNPESRMKPYNGLTKPEKAKNPFTHFCRYVKPAITAEFKNLPPNVNLKEKVQEETHFRWRALKEEEKQFFVKKSMMDHARYENELKIYQEVQQKIEKG